MKVHNRAQNVIRCAARLSTRLSTRLSSNFLKARCARLSGRGDQDRARDSAEGRCARGWPLAGFGGLRVLGDERAVL